MKGLVDELDDTATCDRCNTRYERYTIFFTDDTATMEKRKIVRTKFDHLCEGCFTDEMDPHLGFAID